MSGPRRFGKGFAWNKAGLNVLSLRGTFNEMAAQHGALLKDEIKLGALPYLAEKNSQLVRHSHLFANRPRLQEFALAAIRTLIHRPMLAQVPRHYMEETRELARGAGIPFEICKESLVQADTLNLLLRYFMGRHVLGEMAGGFPGCTSVVAMGPASKSGSMIHGRNMDYPVVGRWEKYPVVFYCDPEGIDRGQRYVGISTAGVHTAGVTSVNESGITVSAHFHCAKLASPFGTPIQFIGSEVVKKARTLGQAIDIIENFERAATWSLVISSAKENKAAVVEMTHGKISVREPNDGTLVHTNHFHTPEFQRKEVLLSPSVAHDYHERWDRASQLLLRNHGHIDRDVVAKILGDHFDGETQKLRAQGNTISVVTTVTSLISEAANGRFWVANATESPVPLGDYMKFDLDENFENYDKREPEIFNWSTEGATTIKNTPKHDALKLFRGAYVAFHTEYDIPKAAECAEAAAAADPEEGHYHMAHGHFRMRLNLPEKALESFRRATKCTMSPHMNQVATLFLGHAFDCVGQRKEALEQYQAIIDAGTSPQLLKEAKTCAARPYRIDRAAKITFDLQFCDSLEYA